MTLLCVTTAAALQAQPAPYHRYRTLETPHFNVHVPAGLEREGRVAGAAAERAYSLLARELHEPRGRIELVVSDDADYSNGFATPIPTNRIVVFATPPIESNALRLNEDWLQLVITHELTHIFHLDRTRGLWSVAQKIFGRGPALFPNGYGPSWLTEGLAVYYESKLTQGGRLRSAEHRLLARTAAMEHRLPMLSELSLGSKVFPGGERAYSYGSLFLEYLANTRGDSALRKLVENQSTTLIPFRLNTDARRAFGVTIEDAYTAFRDSVQRSVGELTPPMPGWRDLTTHPYYAVDARWLNDSLLVYAGSDGRSMPGEFSVTLNGERRRLGRRNSLGPSVPLPNGGLLFAQLDLTSTSEVRSDLYVERNGRQRQLTHGMRLVEPDVRADGSIIAVQIAATRSSLILLDSMGRKQHLLRDAEFDETWSDPRWSPDGRNVVAVHRPHGGQFSIEVIDVADGSAVVLERASAVLSGPAWLRDGSGVVFTTERSGLPVLVSRTCCRPERSEGPAPTLGLNLSSADLSPNGQLVAASTLRADGFHLGVAALSVGASQPAVIDSLRTPTPHALAGGDYHRYWALRSALPKYWYPLIEAAPGRGTRLGATSAGHDVVYRHLWDGYFEIPTTGQYPTGRFTYRYAGFKRPYFDLNLTQDYTAEFDLVNGGTGVREGTLLRRTQTASLGTTFARPRYRTYSAFGVGGAVERRQFFVDPNEFLKQVDTSYARSYLFPSVYVSGQWSNLQRPTLSISPEDGIAVAFTARDRWRSDITFASRSYSVVGTTALYKSLNLRGFAHHVLALRVAGGIADRKAASSFQVGGVSGTTIQLLPGYVVGEGRRTFGVRGFPDASLFGTSAVGGTLEYRVPVTVSAHGFGVLPFFADRSSISGFLDVGSAGCVKNPYVASVCAPSNRLGKTIGSVGLELLQSAAVLDYDQPQNIRVGFAVPVINRDVVSTRVVSVYVAYGLSF